MGFSHSSLPRFPWDSLAPYAEMARRHPDGIVDLSIGTPVDPTPEIVQVALRAAVDSPGYPQTAGTPQLREAVASWFARRRGVPNVNPDSVLPAIGSKEFIALLPSMLGLGAEDVVVYPAAAYPTYDIGARLAAASSLATDSTTSLGPKAPRLIWVNSPSNPTGKVLGVEHLAKVVAWARHHGAIVASDECYAELAWDEPWASTGVPSILDPRVSGGSHEGLLAVYSLSKQSNLAGYRAAFVAGDPAITTPLLELRKHAGMIMPGPVQAAMTVALGDDNHVAEQRARYARRREILVRALRQVGMAIDDSEAGLYLWTRPAVEYADNEGGIGEGVGLKDEQPDPPCWQVVTTFAQLGILVAPGSFYGAQGRRNVRIALTASDERISAAAGRLRRA